MKKWEPCSSELKALIIRSCYRCGAPAEGLCPDDTSENPCPSGPSVTTVSLLPIFLFLISSYEFGDLLFWLLFLLLAGLLALSIKFEPS